MALFAAAPHNEIILDAVSFTLGISMSKTALEIRHLHAWHNHQPIIQDFNLDAKQGEMIALVSTCKHAQTSLLDSLLGINTNRQGSIRIHQTEAIHLAAQHIPTLGMVLCSKDSGLVFGLTCEENLLLPLDDKSLGGGLSLTEIYNLFPTLTQHKDSPCTRLSPGEQQLLAIARVLRSSADIIVLHDLHTDFCPAIHSTAVILLSKLKQLGYTLILNESNRSFATDIVDKCYYIKNAKAHLSTVHHHHPPTCA